MSSETYAYGLSASSAAASRVRVDSLRACGRVASRPIRGEVSEAIRRNVTEALSSASELKHVGLSEALDLCLLLIEKSPDRFGRAALRWHARYCREVRDVDLDEGLAVLATLGALRGPRSKLAASALAELLSRRRRLERACEVLVAWARAV